MTEPTELPFETILLRAVAAELAANPDATVPLLWDDGSVPEYVYPRDGIGIYLDRWPAVEGGTVTLTDYTVSDDFSLSDSVVGLQLTIKDLNRDTVKAITADVFNLLHGRGRGMLGGVTLVSAMRASGTGAGQDSNERQGRIENYYLTVHRPSPNRL